MNKKDNYDFIIQSAIRKIKEAEEAYRQLENKSRGYKREKFIALNLLDFYLTQFSPEQLAELKKLRNKI